MAWSSMRSRVMIETDCGVSRSERLRPVAVEVESVVYEPVPSLACGSSTSALTRTAGKVRVSFFRSCACAGISVARDAPAPTDAALMKRASAIEPARDERFEEPAMCTRTLAHVHSGSVRDRHWLAWAERMLGRGGLERRDDNGSHLRSKGPNRKGPFTMSQAAERFFRVRALETSPTDAMNSATVC